MYPMLSAKAFWRNLLSRGPVLFQPCSASLEPSLKRHPPYPALLLWCPVLDQGGSLPSPTPPQVHIQHALPFQTLLTSSRPFFVKRKRESWEPRTPLRRLVYSVVTSLLMSQAAFQIHRELQNRKCDTLYRRVKWPWSSPSCDPVQYMLSVTLFQWLQIPEHWAIP